MALPVEQDSRLDLIVGFLAICFGVAGLQWMEKLELWDRTFPHSNAVLRAGTVHRESGWVRVKPEPSLIWFDLGPSSREVGNGDMIYTGEDGRALFETRDGIRALILPDSLVVIDTRSSEWAGWLMGPIQSFDFDFRKGQMQIELSRSAKLQLTIGQSVYRIHSFDETASIHLTHDSATGGVQISTDSGSRVEVNDSQILGQVLLPPAAPAPRALPTARAVPIAPPAPSPLAPVARPQTAAAPKATLRPPVQPQRVARPRILPQINAHSTSGSTRFRTLKDLDQVSIELRWEPVPDVAQYQIAVFNSKSTRVLEKIVNEPRWTFIIKSLDELYYKYRVAARLRTGEVITSKAIPVHLELSAPVPTRPAAEERRARGQQILITWERTALTRAYLVEISQRSDFSSVVASASRQDNFFAFPSKATGRFYFRVKSMNGQWQSQWSPIRSFIVK